MLQCVCSGEQRRGLGAGGVLPWVKSRVAETHCLVGSNNTLTNKTSSLFIVRCSSASRADESGVVFTGDCCFCFRPVSLKQFSPDLWRRAEFFLSRHLLLLNEYFRLILCEPLRWLCSFFWITQNRLSDTDTHSRWSLIRIFTFLFSLIFWLKFSL